MIQLFRSIWAFARPKSQLDRKLAAERAAERAVVFQVYRDAQRRRDTRDMNRASAEMQRITHAQLRAELGL